MRPLYVGIKPYIIIKDIQAGTKPMARQSPSDDFIIGGFDKLDSLLRDFKSRNEHRSDPKYVIEPIDPNTTIPERFVKILRGSSLEIVDEDAVVEEVPVVEEEPTPGLILLSQNYDRSAEKKLLRSKIAVVIAAVILLVAVLSFSVAAGYLWAGLVLVALAAGFIIFSRVSRSQAYEIHAIASALAQPEDAS